MLEIGPGTGYYSIEAARRVGSAGRLVCVDIQPEMLAETRARLHRIGAEHADFVQADAALLPFRSGSFDRVFLVGVLGEITDPRRAVEEFHRVLRGGGYLSVSEQVPDPDFITRASLRRLLRPAGFIEVVTRGHLWYTSTWRSTMISSTHRDDALAAVSGN